MVPTIYAVGETRESTTVDTSSSTPAPTTKNKLTTPNQGLVQPGSSNFVGHVPTRVLSPDFAHIIRAAWRVSAQSEYNTPVQQWLDFWNRQQLNPCQATVSQVLDLLHTLYEFGLSYSDILKCSKCNSRDPRSPKARLTLVSVSVYERNLSTETSTTKIHQDIGR